MAVKNCATTLSGEFTGLSADAFGFSQGPAAKMAVAAKSSQERAAQGSNNRDERQGDRAAPAFGDLVAIGKCGCDVAGKLGDGGGRICRDRRHAGDGERTKGEEGATAGNGIDRASKKGRCEQQQHGGDGHGVFPFAIETT
jgi:hypothetical protein